MTLGRRFHTIDFEESVTGWSWAPCSFRGACSIFRDVRRWIDSCLSEALQGATEALQHAEAAAWVSDVHIVYAVRFCEIKQFLRDCYTLRRDAGNARKGRLWRPFCWNWRGRFVCLSYFVKWEFEHSKDLQRPHGYGFSHDGCKGGVLGDSWTLTGSFLLYLSTFLSRSLFLEGSAKMCDWRSATFWRNGWERCAPIENLKINRGLTVVKRIREREGCLSSMKLMVLHSHRFWRFSCPWCDLFLARAKHLLERRG